MPSNKMSSEDQVLDRERLKELHSLSSNGESVLEDLIPLFISTFASELLKLRRSIFKKNCKSSYAFAHAMISSSQNVGATRLARICCDMETAAKTEDLKLLESHLKELLVAWNEVQETLVPLDYNLDQLENA